jgi:competence protein ComEA
MLSRKESNGFFIICGFMLLFIFIPAIYQPLFYPPTELSESDERTLNSLVASLEADTKEPSPASFPKKKFDKKEKIYSDFNPNTSSEKEMTDAGIPEFISKRIIKFRSKGGKFKTKNDFKKIYGLSENLYGKLSEHILITENNNFIRPSISTDKSFVKNTRRVFDINTVDSLGLLSLRGIGPSFAGRILKFRNKLGGFIVKEQYKEIYGLDSIALSELMTYSFIEKDFVPEKININSATIVHFFSHPYIGRRTGQLIIHYREQHGDFRSIEDLKNIQVISDEVYKKIIPYLLAE